MQGNPHQPHPPCAAERRVKRTMAAYCTGLAGQRIACQERCAPDNQFCRGLCTARTMSASPRPSLQGRSKGRAAWVFVQRPSRPGVKQGQSRTAGGACVCVRGPKQCSQLCQLDGLGFWVARHRAVVKVDQPRLRARAIHHIGLYAVEQDDGSGWYTSMRATLLTSQVKMDASAQRRSMRVQLEAGV